MKILGKMTLFLVLLMFLLSSLSAYSVVPVVKNMNYIYIGGTDKIIRIQYNLDYPGAGAVAISFVGSDDGVNFNLTPSSVNGDIGNVMPGLGKVINWKVLNDYPTVNPSKVIIKLTADDGDHNIQYITMGGADMVLIPAGNFQMGSITTPDGMPIFGDEMPQHTVFSNAFYMDTHEVTNMQYASFLIATGHTPPMYWADAKFNAPDQPVVGVTWEDAVAYCNWVGKRLPTEAEWEKAAKGGLGYEFPWGNTLSRNYGNFASIEGPDIWYDTSPVRSFLPNNYGLFDIIGNVYEWCSDYYDYYYYSSSPNSNPTGPENGETKVLRGGSCYDGFFPSYLRSATRYSYSPVTMNGIVGFRCVMDAPN